MSWLIFSLPEILKPLEANNNNLKDNNKNNKEEKTKTEKNPQDKPQLVLNKIGDTSIVYILNLYYEEERKKNG